MSEKSKAKASHDATFEQSGFVTFPDSNGPPRKFRFTVAAADNKLRIWLEDTVSKEQWKVSDLAPADFVTEDTAIPQAKAENYALCIVKCLTPAAPNAEASTSCSLSRPAADGSRVLCVGFSMDLGMFKTRLEYTFTLPAVKLEKTDLLAAQVRDLVEMIEELKAENRELKAQKEEASVNVKNLESVMRAHHEELLRITESNKHRSLKEEIQDNVVTGIGNRVKKLEAPMEFVRATTTSNHSSGQCLVWHHDPKTNSGIVSFEQGEIKFLQPGVYEINMMLWHQTTSDMVSFELMHGKTSLQQRLTYYTNRIQENHLYHVFDAKINDTLTVYYRGNCNAHAQSTLTIIKRSSSK